MCGACAARSARCQSGQPRRRLRLGSIHSGSGGGAGERVLHGAGHRLEAQALGQRVDRLERRQALGLAGAEHVVGMHHLGDAVEELDPAGDDAPAAGGQRPAQPVGAGLEVDELELGQGVADVDAVRAAAHGRRLVQADLDLDGHHVGKPRLADRAAQPTVDARARQGQHEVDRLLDLHPGEELGRLRPHAVKGGQRGEEREEDVGAAHRRGIFPGSTPRASLHRSRAAGRHGASAPPPAGGAARRRRARGGAAPAPR